MLCPIHGYGITPLSHIKQGSCFIRIPLSYHEVDVLCERPLAPSPPIELPARQVLFCSFCVLPVFKDSSTKGDKFLRFCHKTRSIPTKRHREGGRHVPRSYVLLAGRILVAGLVVKIFTPKAADGERRPLSWIPAEFVDPS